MRVRLRARLVLNLIKGQRASKARNTLMLQRNGAATVGKLLQSRSQCQLPDTEKGLDVDPTIVW